MTLYREIVIQSLPLLLLSMSQALIRRVPYALVENPINLFYSLGLEI
jgi:hypothetical protein